MIDLPVELIAGILVLEKNKIIYLNPPLKKYLGFSLIAEAEELFQTLVHPEDLPLLDQNFLIDHHPLTLRLKNSNGSYLKFDFYPLVSFDSKKILITRDVSMGRKEKETDSGYNKSSVEPTFSNHPLEATFFVQNGSIIALNDEAAKFLGYLPAEINELKREFGLGEIFDLPMADHFSDLKSRKTIDVGLRAKQGQIIPVKLAIEPLTGLSSQAEKIYQLKIIDKKNASRIQQFDKKLGELRSIYHGILSALNRLIDIKDPYNAKHHQRVSDLARAIATVMDLPSETIEAVRVAGAIHDLGKLVIPSEIIAKPGNLTPYEFNLIKLHPEAGYEILKSIHFPWPVAEIVLQHHEHLDGSGYPYGLKGDEIRTEARIITVADVVEAIVSHRPYRPALSLEEAFSELENKKGTVYDSQAVEACLFLFKEIGYSFDSREWVPRLISYIGSNFSASLQPD